MSNTLPPPTQQHAQAAENHEGKGGRFGNLNDAESEEFVLGRRRPSTPVRRKEVLDAAVERPATQAAT